MLLHTHVYLIEKEDVDLGLPHDHSSDEIAPAVIRIETIEFAYPLDAEHTQIATVNDRMKIKTSYYDVVKAMERIDKATYNADGSVQ